MNIIEEFEGIIISQEADPFGKGGTTSIEILNLVIDINGKNYNTKISIGKNYIPFLKKEMPIRFNGTIEEDKITDITDIWLKVLFAPLQLKF